MANAPYSRGPFHPDGTPVNDPSFGSGMGGVSFDLIDAGPQPGGPVGLGAWGSWQPGAPDFQNGVAAHGLNPMGGADKTPSRVLSAKSLDRLRIEVTFQTQLDPTDAALVNPANWLIQNLVGAGVTLLTVTPTIDAHTDAPVDEARGVTVVVLTHSGTTLGGTYAIHAAGMRDMSGNVVLDVPFVMWARGDPALTATATAQTGGKVLIEFDRAVRVQDVSGQTSIVRILPTNLSWPIQPTALALTCPWQGSDAKALLSIQGMTGIGYDLTLGGSIKVLSWSGTSNSLPSAAIDLSGVETGQGSSSMVGSSALSISRLAGFNHGWRWISTGAQPTPGTSSWIASVDLDLSQIVTNPAPAMFPPTSLVDVTFEDGVIGVGMQVKVSLTRDNVLAPILRISSGAFTTDVAADWTVAARRLALVRNPLVGITTILLNDVPVLSTATGNLVGLASDFNAAGISVNLPSAQFDLAGVRVSGLRMTASDTLHDAALNVVHDLVVHFNGLADQTVGKFLVSRGPLVKSWGDMSPATKEDVSVKVRVGNAAPVAVPVADVDALHGQITLEVPLPLLPASADVHVLVDYQWMPSATQGLSTNRLGSITNLWASPKGHVEGSGQTVSGSGPGGRFPARATSGPPTARPQALLRGWRWLGFERDQTSATNSPTTLLTNRVQGAPAKPPLERDLAPDEFAWAAPDALTGFTPEGAALASTVAGLDGAGEPALVLSDVGTQQWQGAGLDPGVAYWLRQADAMAPCAITLATRMHVRSSTPDGVYTGVGFGVHDGLRLWLAGIVVVDGVTHAGLLHDASKPHLEASWTLGPATQADVLSKTTLRMPAIGVPTGLVVGNRVRIQGGPQAGVHTILQIATPHSDVELTVAPALPNDPQAFASGSVAILFEIGQALPSSWRLEVDPGRVIARLSVAGQISGLVAARSGRLAECPAPSQTTLVLPDSPRGAVLWGSVSRLATSVSAWSMFRHSIVPDVVRLVQEGIKVNAEMGVLPDRDPGAEWAPVGLGSAKIDVANRLLMTAEGMAPGWRRIEPALQPDVVVDLSLGLSVETGTKAGDAVVDILDGEVQARVGTLTFIEGAWADRTWRRLITLPALGFVGGLPVTGQGWTLSLSSGAVVDIRGDFLRLARTGALDVNVTGALGLSDLAFTDSQSRVLQSRLTVSTVVALSGASGIRMSMAVADRMVTLEPRIAAGVVPDGFRLLDEAGAVVAQADVPWNDGLEHEWRVVADAGSMTVSVLLDDVAIPPLVDLGLFLAGAGTALCKAGLAVGAAGDSCDVLWRSFSVAALPPTGTRRTLGIWRGGPTNDIDSWELPRTDATPAANSEQTGPVIQEMDWRQQMDVRVLRDPDWGVSVHRPDLPLPPYASNDVDKHIDEWNDPSRAWINLERALMPKVVSSFGSISFGSLAGSVGRQRWDWVRYRIWRTPDDDRNLASAPMVTNRWWLAASAERTRARAPELLAISSLDARRVSLLPAHVRASALLRIVDGLSSLFPGADFTFDARSQTATLVQGKAFSSASAPLTLTYIPGGMPTREWLAARPLLESTNLLDEDEPPIIHQLDGSATRQIVLGAHTNDDLSLSNQNLLTNDPVRTVEFADQADALYLPNPEVLSIEDGQSGLIATVSDDLLPEGTSGWMQSEGAPAGTLSIWMSGTAYTDGSPTPVTAIGDDQGGGSFGKFLFWSGGGFVHPDDAMPEGLAPLGGLWGQVMLWPLPALGCDPTPAAQAAPDLSWDISMSQVTISDHGAANLAEVLGALGDDIPPGLALFADPALVPAGAQGVGNGKVAFQMVKAGNFSRFGPAGGMDVLSPDNSWLDTGVTQSSLWGGGDSTLDVNGDHDPLKGWVWSGGVDLPDGATTTTMI